LKVAHDVIEQLLWVVKDPRQAVEFIERSLLPVVNERKMAEFMLDLRSMYAISLAMDGQGQRALDELQAIEPYVEGLNDHDRQVHERRVQIVHDAIAEQNDESIWKALSPTDE
jgi:hypothetical protein